MIICSSSCNLRGSIMYKCGSQVGVFATLSAMQQHTSPCSSCTVVVCFSLQLEGIDSPQFLLAHVITFEKLPRLTDNRWIISELSACPIRQFGSQWPSWMCSLSIYIYTSSSCSCLAPLFFLSIITFSLFRPTGSSGPRVVLSPTLPPPSLPYTLFHVPVPFFSVHILIYE